MNRSKRVSISVLAAIFVTITYHSAHAAGSGYALDFDGVNDHVEVNDSTSLQLTTAGTLEAWVYLFGTPNNAGIIHKGDGSTGEAYSLQFGSGAQADQVKLVVNNGSTTQSITSSTSLSKNVWYHIAGTWDNATTHSMNLYINGVLDKTGTDTISAQNTVNEKLIIGAQYDFGTDPFSGRIDEVRIWNYAFGTTAIRTNMCKKLTGSESNLVGYWRFDEGSGTTCANAVTGGNAANFPSTAAYDPTWVLSGAAIGDASTYNYSSPSSVTLSHSSGDSFTISNITGSPDGVQLYRVDSAPDITISPLFWKSFDTAARYWGTFIVGGTNPTYTVEYNYGGYPTFGGLQEISSEETLKLAYRKGNSDTLWKDLNATLDTNAHTLTKSDMSGTEYILGSLIDPRNAINFNGSSDYVGVSDEGSLDLTGAGTLEAWINIASYPVSGAGIIHKGDGATTGYSLYMFGTHVNLTLYNGVASTISSADKLNLGTWYHVAGVWDTSNMYLYLNGVQDASGPSGGGAANPSGNNLYIGVIPPTTGTQYFSGTIDEVRVWNSTRTQTQIRDNMCKKITTRDPNLVGYWRFDEETTSPTNYDFGTTPYNFATMYGFGTAGAIIAARVCSSAPIGDRSAYQYYDGGAGTPMSVTLTHPDGDYMFATKNGGYWFGTFSGLQIYEVDGPPVYPPDINGPLPYDPYTSPNGLTPPSTWSSVDYYRYWGVFLTDWLTGGSEPTYGVVYNYGTPGSGNPSMPQDETVVALAKRDSYCDRTWADAAATLNTTANTLTKSSETQNGPPKTYTEYVLAGKSQPLAITLASFTAEALNGCIEINWATATEIDTVGFQLWRSDRKNGAYTLVSGSYTKSKSVIDTQGAQYSFTDCDVKLDGKTNYYYKLEEIDLDNSKTNPMYGPIGPVDETVSASQASTATSRSKDDKACFISIIGE